METIIPLLISLLPKQVAAIQYLKLVPEAFELVKELTAEVQRVLALLKGPLVPKTPEQEALLDASIAALNDDPYMAEEKPPSQSP